MIIIDEQNKYKSSSFKMMLEICIFFDLWERKGSSSNLKTYFIFVHWKHILPPNLVALGLIVSEIKVLIQAKTTKKMYFLMLP